MLMIMHDGRAIDVGPDGSVDVYWYATGEDVEDSEQPSEPSE